ncbi:MAG: hypothetical protein COV43_00545 [Deltaproteobacteria bacterium CG11_big_fil_rev_8_21_14_0_20_42_23]|nr:MAG: hypothetical protein COV43_00545 [Deltaproteobacteria bacterium CG11_big_fil_rev_8_21_14_0_20_42_23]PJC64508.1 MAG: hypothetical protein CO021_03530 [Deltaproteobacteria bacterium CG_4_9_14_0_2_um_filter_42_21]
MTLSPRQELLQLQKKLFFRNKRQIEDSILVKEPAFDRYEATYKRNVSKYQKAVTPEKMIEAVLKADIIYVGDYHTCNQSQRSFLRVLKLVSKETKSFVVGLELLHAKHQKVLDQYLAGKISEALFLKKIKLQEHWVFDLWDSFKPLFDFCKYHNIPIKAIDAAKNGSSVQKRDEATAKLLVDLMDQHPNDKLFVFIGDLHIAPQHLPKDVKKILKAKKKNEKSDLILYQNSESIYWKLAEKGAYDRVEVVQINENSFCRMHTPPVVCQRSYINWLEHEEGEIDYADAKHSFIDLVQQICKFLNLSISEEDLESVEIFTAGDLSFLKKLRATKRFTKDEIETIKEQILSSESYYIAKARFVYLSNLSLNHAAEEASHCIKHILSGDEEPRDLVDAFYANILHEALGFFGSKIINHKRKCFHDHEFRELVQYFRSSEVPMNRATEHEAAHYVVEYLNMEKKGQPLEFTELFRVRIDLFIAITHAIGYILGDKLYYALMDKVLTKKQARELFVDAWKAEGRPVEVYFALKKKLQKVKIPKRL